MKLSIVLLVASLVMALGGWMMTLKTWDAALLPLAMGGLLFNLGGVVVAWLGKSPIKPGGTNGSGGPQTGN